MKKLQIIIIYFLVLIIVLISSKILANFLKPQIKDTKSEFNNFTDYINSVYNRNFPDVIIDYNIVFCFGL